jgi:hypothetical protein
MIIPWNQLASFNSGSVRYAEERGILEGRKWREESSQGRYKDINHKHICTSYCLCRWLRAQRTDLDMTGKKKKEEIHCQRCGKKIDPSKSYYQVNYDKGENVVDKYECSPCYLGHVNI